MRYKRNNYIHYLVIIIVCFFAFFINNHVIPADLMESRNLATAQEMVRTGNYLIPTLNGELRLEKPPLPTWIAAGVEHLLPDNLIAQRCVAGLSATLMVFFLFFLVRRLAQDPLPALIASVVLASCFNVIMMGRTATWDIYCHSFMLGGIYFMVAAIENNGRQWGRFMLAGIFMGLSFLSKGPVSFYALLIPFVISYYVATRFSLKSKKLPLLLMIVLVVIVSFWWPAYIAIYHPETGLAVAGKESTNWLNYNVRPIWYYWKFPAEAGIWCVFWVTSIVYFFWKKKPEKRQVFKFSIIWTIAIFVLLSVIPEKKTRYLLPILIPGAMNIAFYFYQSIKTAMSKSERILFKINGTLIGVIALIIPVAFYFFMPGGKEISLLMIIVTVLSVVIGICMFTTLYNKQKIRVLSFFALTVMLMIMFESFCLASVGKMFINDERHSIRMLRQEPRVAGLPFYSYDKELIRMELVYELNQTIRPLDITDDSLMQAKMPFVFVSTEPAAELFKNKPVEIEFIGAYDNNWRRTDDKRYNLNLKKDVVIVYPGKVQEISDEEYE